MANEVMRVQWSRRATQNLQDIAENLREQSATREQQLLSQLIAASQSLAIQPRLGQRLEASEETGEVRTLLVIKKFRLVYEILDEERIVVLQVLGLRQNNTFYR